MKLVRFFLICLISIIPVILCCTYFKPTKEQEATMIYNITSSDDIKKLFPKTEDEINHLASATLKQAQSDVAQIIAIPLEQKTFANTVRAYDTVFMRFRIPCNTLEVLSMVNEILSGKAAEQLLVLKNHEVDIFAHNKKLYDAINEYATHNAPHENLTKKELYFLDNLLQDYRRRGIDLPEDKRDKVSSLEKEITELSIEFAKNIAADKSSIQVTKEELAGLDEDFINNLKKAENGLYILGVDYPTYYKVISFADKSETRRKIMEAFNNRAYPQNVAVLEALIEKRDNLAQILGFESFAHLALADQMVQTPERAQQFLDDLLKKVAVKEQLEFEKLAKDLPTQVKLSVDGKINAWDRPYLIEQYKKTHYNLDENKITDYFPMENTIKQLLNIYQQFLDLEFQEGPMQGLWDPEIRLITVYQNKQLIGYILLDLYPRPNKFTHACEATVIPAMKFNNVLQPAVAVVIANFPKATASQPSLLKRADVKTFFHEFGHALHALLGATELGSISGVYVKTDFVEMPSQMLEEWLWDPGILKQVSHHYKTGESLSDETIKTLIDLKTLSTGNDTQRQIALSLLSLDYFKKGSKKDIDQIFKNINHKIRTNESPNPNSHVYTAFGHLTDYDARYYSYLWSRVFALALFDHIKKFGLLNPEIGRQYKHKILEQGGSKDPNELLVDFLGHEPTQDAFIRDLGL
jgi:thimet oligopeptidase